MIGMSKNTILYFFNLTNIPQWETSSSQGDESPEPETGGIKKCLHTQKADLCVVMDDHDEEQECKA